VSMNILHTVEFYYPSKGGAQEVVKQISERLVQKGHSVTVATTYDAKRINLYHNGVKIEQFHIAGNAVRGLQEEKSGEIERYRNFVLNGQFDVMMNYAAQQWTFDGLFPFIDNIKFPSILAPCGFSGLYNNAYNDYFETLVNHLQHYTGHILHSSSYQDADFYRKNAIPFMVIPNGASEEEFSISDTQSLTLFRQKYKIPHTIPLLITIGSHTGLKGHRLVIEAFRRANIGEAVLVVIGNTLGTDNCLWDCRRRAWRTILSSYGKKKVYILDISREETIQALKAADLFLFGSNIECSPLVIFEAIAAGTPFIATDVGNCREIVEWTHNAGIIVEGQKNEHGLFFASRADFASAIETMLSNSQQLQQRSLKAQSAWQQHFTWQVIADKYEQFYDDTIKSYKR
jgi:glycosyltransferase involved in cell wall biosynthesis